MFNLEMQFALYGLLEEGRLHRSMKEIEGETSIKRKRQRSYKLLNSMENYNKLRFDVPHICMLLKTFQSNQ